MHTEEIIRAWKAEDDDVRNGQVPVNPAGNIEIDDDDLEDVSEENITIYVCRLSRGPTHTMTL